MNRHWKTTYDPDDGEPFGTICECGLGEDHNERQYKEFLMLMSGDGDWGQDSDDG